MPVNIKYFRDQFRRPYESTKKFTKWLENIKFIQNKTNCFCVDIGCGMGETLYYMAKKFPNTSFEGIDRSKNLIRLGKKIFKQKISFYFFKKFSQTLKETVQTSNNLFKNNDDLTYYLSFPAFKKSLINENNRILKS